MVSVRPWSLVCGSERVKKLQESNEKVDAKTLDEMQKSVKKFVAFLKVFEKC